MSEVVLYQKSVTALIPAQYLNELLYWRDQINNGAWRIGDITNELYVLSLANNQTTSKLDICAAVGTVVGKSSRTIRYYADTAGFFPKEIRQVYSDVLPFSHFVLAKAMGEEAGSSGQPLWQETLDQAIDYMSQHQVPPSRERLMELMSAPIENKQERLTSETPPAPSLLNLPDLPLEAKFGEISQNQQDALDNQVFERIKKLLEPIPALLERIMALRRGQMGTREVQLVAQAKILVEEALLSIGELQ